MLRSQKEVGKSNIDLARGTVPIVPLVLEYQENMCYVKFGQPIVVGINDDKQNKIDELEDAFVALKWEIWELMPVIHRDKSLKEQWEAEVQRRLEGYPLVDYKYEKSCVRERADFQRRF